MNMRALITLVESLTAPDPAIEQAVYDYVRSEALGGGDDDIMDYYKEARRRQKRDLDFDEWLKGYVRNRLKQTYANLRTCLGSDGKLHLYRVITAPDDWQPDPNRHPGIYWSWDEEAAQAHWGNHNGTNTEWMLEAAVDEDAVDWIETLARNVMPVWEEEREIRLKKDAPVEIAAYYEREYF